MSGFLIVNIYLHLKKTLNPQILHLFFSEYTDDEGLIPKGSSVIVRRIPIIGGKSGSSSKIRNM